MANEYEIVMRFLKRKNRLFEWLNAGIIIKAEWDNAIQEAENLGLEASKQQLLRYYQHYEMADLANPKMGNAD